jgi:hypothetical protein
MAEAQRLPQLPTNMNAASKRMHAVASNSKSCSHCTDLQQLQQIVCVIQLVLLINVVRLQVRSCW